MRVYIHYKITEQPWGGGNSFLKYFRGYLDRQGIEQAHGVNDEYDVLLANAAHKAPGRYLDLDELAKIKENGYANYKRYIKSDDKVLFYRSDGFRGDYTNVPDESDKIQSQCLNLCDCIIFQNKFCLESAKRHGYGGDRYRIIHNGVDQDVFRIKDEFWDGKRKLKVLSASWSPNPNKGFEDIAEFSMLSDVESAFYGNWPKEIDPKNVEVNPPADHKALADIYRAHDILLHPARFDASPNVCLEAISCGLPIIYHKTSGIKEVAANCGLQFTERESGANYEAVCKRYTELVDTIKENREYFSIDRCAGQYIDYFRGVLDGKV